MAPLLGVNRRWLPPTGAAAPAIAPAWRACRRCNRLLAWGTPPSMQTAVLLFQLAPRINAVGPAWGTPSWWWSCSPTADDERAHGAGPGVGERFQPDQRPRSSVMRSRPKAVPVESGRPGADPVFCCCPSAIGTHGRDRGGAARLGERFGLPVASAGRRGQTDACRSSVRAPRGFACGSGPEPLQRCWSAMAVTPAAGGVHRAGRDVAAFASAPQWVWQVIVEERQQSGAPWSQKPGSPWIGHSQFLPGGTCSGSNRSGGRPGGAGVFWVWPVARSIDSACLAWRPSELNLEQGSAVSGRLPGVGRVKVPFPSMVECGPLPLAHQNAGKGQNACNSNWWALRPSGGGETWCCNGRERTYLCRPRWGRPVDPQ